MLRYVISGLRNAPKDGKVSENQKLNIIFTNLTSIFKLFLDEDNNCLENKSGDDHEENVLWKSKTAEEWYKFPKVQDDLLLEA